MAALVRSSFSRKHAAATPQILSECLASPPQSWWTDKTMPEESPAVRIVDHPLKPSYKSDIARTSPHCMYNRAGTWEGRSCSWSLPTMLEDSWRKKRCGSTAIAFGLEMKKFCRTCPLFSAICCFIVCVVRVVCVGFKSQPDWYFMVYPEQVSCCLWTESERGGYRVHEPTEVYKSFSDPSDSHPTVAVKFARKPSRKKKWRFMICRTGWCSTKKKYPSHTNEWTSSLIRENAWRRAECNLKLILSKS
jgi:hypothetical protein